MSNFIQKGITWFQKQRHKHTTRLMQIGITPETSVELWATPVEEDDSTTQETLNQPAQVFGFVFKRSDFVDNNIKLLRGLKIWFDNNTYEITMVGKTLYEYNDTERKDIVVWTTLVKDNEKIVPVRT